MKFFYAFCFSALLSISVKAQYITSSFTYGGVTRQYILYVPTSYTGAQPVPFVLALHGLGDNMNNFKNINFKAVADTANFIVAFPQALVDNLTGSTAWNSGAGAFGVSLNANVDDVGFLNALIDTVAANYNVDQTRLYATGFSMGGFMSNRLACQLNNRIAAIASVSGTIGNVLNCQPARVIPVAHFHGTADGTVAYSGNQYGKDAEVSVMYWVKNDGCDTVPVIDSLPNTKNDGKSIIKYSYLNGKYGSEVELFKVVGGAHEWLTAANDITYTVEIWRFFSRFKWEQQSTGVTEANPFTQVSIYPNPVGDNLHIELADYSSPAQIIVYNNIGEQVAAKQITGTGQISLEGLPVGHYAVKVTNGNGHAVYHVVKQ